MKADYIDYTHNCYRIFRVETMSLMLDDYSVTVLVGPEGSAFCTCRTFQHIDYGNHHLPIRYFGSTGAHGCKHIDRAVTDGGWQEEPTGVQASIEERVGQLEDDLGKVRSALRQVIDSLADVWDTD